MEPPLLDPPAGVEIVTLAERPELARGIYEVAAEALPDVPGSEDWLPPPFEQFVAAHLHGLPRSSSRSPDDEVDRLREARRTRPDGRTADHGMTAVKREWRNRGVAQALKRAQIAWAKANGIERLTAANEERNAPMQHINSLLGYPLAVPGACGFARRPSPDSSLRCDARMSRGSLRRRVRRCVGA